MKTALMIIAQDQFRDEELFVTRKTIQDKGIKTIVASTTLEEVKGSMGGTEKPQLLINNVDTSKYDAVVFVGGAGSSQYWNDTNAHKIAIDMYSAGKIIAAICIAPVTLSKAGLLKNKKFTVWNSEVNTIINNGGLFVDEPVVVDGKIVTGNGPQASNSFGLAISELVLKN